MALGRASCLFVAMRPEVVCALHVLQMAGQNSLYLMFPTPARTNFMKMHLQVKVDRAYRKREITSNFRQLVQHGLWKPIIRTVYGIYGVRNENPLMSKRLLAAIACFEVFNITSEILLFARQAANLGIYTQTGPAVNLLNHRLVKTPSSVQKSDTKGILV